jgi:hypothetical protein
MLSLLCNATFSGSSQIQISDPSILFNPYEIGRQLFIPEESGPAPTIRPHHQSHNRVYVRDSWLHRLSGSN